MPLELEEVALLAPLVGDADLQPGVEEGELAEALAQHVELEVGGLEDGGVGLEPHRGATLVGGSDFGDLLLRQAPGVALLVDLPVPGDLQTQPLAERVDHGHADAVKATRDLVGAVLEFSSSVELGHHHVDGVHASHRGMWADGNAATVVLHADAAVDVDGDDDLGGGLGQGLVDAVVHDLVDEVVQAVDAGVADVHPGTLPDGLQTFEDGDGRSAVLGHGGPDRGLGSGFVFARSVQGISAPIS